MIDITSFFKVTYGLYVLSSKNNQGKFNGHINNTALQVTAEPPRFIVASNKKNLTTDYILESRVFSVSILQQDIDLKFMGPWGFQSGRETDKFTDLVNYKTGTTGVPILLDKTIAWLECKVFDIMDVGTHLIFAGDVIAAEMINTSAKPLTYSYYRDVIKGISPENAPTYIDKSKLEEVKHLEENKASKYQCVICGYIYDPEEGDPDSGISPGTPFEDIPDDWQCPICGVTKRDFRKI